MNLTVQKYLYVVALFLTATVTSMAQLRVSLNITAHPDPYLSNWASRKETATVLITNTGTNSVDVKFDCKIYLDGALVVNTKPESMRVLRIPPGASQFNGEDLVPFESVKITGNADKTAIKTGMLPAGSYQFCVALLNPQTNAEITKPVCKNFTLTSYQAPVLLQPAEKSKVGKGKRPLFKWTPVSPKYPGQVNYRVVVFEILKGQSPATAFRANRPILDRSVSATQLQWPADLELPKDDGQYVWGVIATDDNGNTVGEPGGLGGPGIFFGCCTDTSDKLVKDNDPDTSGPGVKKDNDPDTSGPGILNDADKPGKITPADKIFTDTKPGQGDCPTLLSPKNGAHLDKPDDFMFRWTPVLPGMQERKTYLLIQDASKAANATEGYVLRVDVTGKTSYNVDKSVSEKMIRTGGSWRWSVQPEGGPPCPTMLFTTGPCNPLLKINEITATCTSGNTVHICLKFYYSDSQNRPLTFAQTGSGILAWQMPGYTPQLSTTNFTNPGPVTISTLSIPSGTTYSICFDVLGATSGQIDIGIQGDNLNANPNIICRPGVDSVINNPCICDKCDSTKLKIKLTGGQVKSNPGTGSLTISQPMSIGPDQVTAIIADIIYVHWEPEKEKCMACDKKPSEWGVLHKATFNGIDGNPTPNEAAWAFTGGTGNSGVFMFNIGMPQVMECCKLRGTICIRYKFYLKSPGNPGECYECERVICYSF